MFSDLSVQKRKEIFIQAESLTHISAQAIEKDWWVTAVLKVLFSSEFENSIVFKGGTSLSKGWHLIERFSEDIDIAIDREFLGFSGKLSKNQISDKLRRASCSFVRNELKDCVSHGLKSLGIKEDIFTVKTEVTPITTTDPEKIFIEYESVFDNVLNDYVKPRVIIEAGARSMSDPSVKREINSIVSEVFPSSAFKEENFIVRAAPAERTFLEKAFLLHEEFHKPDVPIKVERMSRHLYDLEKMMDTEIGKAIYDRKLYDSIIKHRKTFIGLKGFDYNSLQPDTIDFVPPVSIIKEWEADYAKMQESMIYGISLPFNSLIERINILNNRFRNLR